MRALRCGEGENLLLWNVDPIGNGGIFSSLVGEGNGDPKRKSAIGNWGSLAPSPFFEKQKKTS